MKNLVKRKFYASACGSSHGNFLAPLGFEPTDKLEESDIIIFGGGADIEPGTYGEEPGKQTYTSPQREKREKEDFEIGRKLGKKFFGICRGHQFLTAMAGGKLIQDVSGHAGSDHTVTTFDGITVRTNSIHHQMINPYTIKSKSDYKILAWTPRRISKRYLGANDKSVMLPWEFKEIEAIYYPKINAFSVQYHPEMMFHYSKQHEAIVNWTQDTFIKFFNNKL